MDKEKINEYRNQIIKSVMDLAVLANKEISEEEAAKLTSMLSDEELEEGMEWNTPDDVAELLLDSGL